jgi:pyruvate dehydrogenase E1 component alpha subunit
MSQEDPTIVVTPVAWEKFIGGAGIVALHARGLGADVQFFSVAGKDEIANYAKTKLESLGVNTHLFQDESRPTTLKQRFRARQKTLLRVSHLRQHSISAEIRQRFYKEISDILGEADLVIFADFNYGCLPQTLVDQVMAICDQRGIMMVADSQSSSQVGDVSRFKKMTLVTPTEREARFAVHDFESGLVVLAEKLRRKSATKNVIITLGEEGVLIHAETEKENDWLTDRLPAFAVGVCANLRNVDYVMSTHRAHGHYLAKGGNLKAMISEIYGKATGCSKGKGGSQHLIDLDAGFLGSTPIVGSIIPIATGVAFGITFKDTQQVSAVFIGDASTEEGVFTESLNFAALKKLPILFVCENNFFSVYSPLSVRQPAERDNLALARAYGIYADRGDGNNILDIYEITKKAVSHIQAGNGPAYLEFDTYRWREHCGPNFDNNIGYRTEEEYLAWRKRCPIKNFERQLKENGCLTEQQTNQMKVKIETEIEEAFSFAKTSPFPEALELYSDLYA